MSLRDRVYRRLAAVLPVRRWVDEAVSAEVCAAPEDVEALTARVAALESHESQRIGALEAEIAALTKKLSMANGALAAASGQVADAARNAEEALAVAQKAAQVAQSAKITAESAQA